MTCESFRWVSSSVRCCCAIRLSRERNSNSRACLWLVANDRGDPQKAAPCGGDAKDKGAPSNIVGKAVGGQKVRVRVLETIYHPGHYRIALAVNSRDELPPDPVTTTRETEKGPRSVWAVVQSPPQKPVLADGLFPHYTKPAQPQTYEADIELPNINCAKCTLQIVQWMAEHGFNNPGGYRIPHCADCRSRRIRQTSRAVWRSSGPLLVFTRRLVGVAIELAFAAASNVDSTRGGQRCRLQRLHLFLGRQMGSARRFRFASRRLPYLTFFRQRDTFVE